MKRLLLTAAAASLVACGLKVNINGKTTTLGGSIASNTKAQAKAAATEAAKPADTATADSSQPAAAPQVSDEERVVETITLDSSLNAHPKQVRAEGVMVNGKFSKVIGGKGWPDCGSDMTTKPVAAFEIKDAVSATARIAVVGGGNDGFILKHQDGVYWTICTYSSGDVPMMTGAPKEGWKPGRYEIYPLARYGGKSPRSYTVEFFDPEKPIAWSEAVQKISIAKKLDKPMFVEVTTKPGRAALRETHAGYGCKKALLPVEPDIALTLERPIPGLWVRPLFTKTPVTLRVQTPDTANKKSRKYCSSWERRVVANNYSPSWESPVEVHFDKDDEGTFGLSIGTPNADEELKVTLMIFDSSSQWEPLAGIKPEGELPLEERLIERYYPQLDVRELSIQRHKNATLATDLFAAAPQELFVYSKLDLDKDIARLHASAIEPDGFPKKNEPLLLVDIGRERATVLTADGLKYSVKNTHLLPAPDGAVAFPAAPRKLRKDVSYSEVLQMAPPASEKHQKAHYAVVAKYDKCADATWAPFGKKIKKATYLVRSTSVHGSDVEVETPKARKIREQGQAVIDRKCGKQSKLDKSREAARVKILSDIEKERVKLLAKARGGRF